MIEKPKSCNQKWSEMKTAEGGRICLKCEKLIIDFRNKKWNEINTIHNVSNNPVCGIYTNRQLENWGNDKNNFIFLKNTLPKLTFALASVLNNVNSYGKINFEKSNEIIQVQKNVVIDNKHKNKNCGRFVYDINKLPLSNVKIEIIKNGVIIEQITSDDNGRFYFNKNKSTKNSIARFSLYGYRTIEVSINKIKDKKYKVILDGVVSEDISIGNVEHFYASPPTIIDTLIDSVKNLIKDKK